MADEIRRIGFGCLMVLLGFLGLVLFGKAEDVGMEAFGLGLMIFAALFWRGLVVRHYPGDRP